MKRQELQHPQAHLSAVTSGAEKENLDFDELFARYTPYVANVALRLLGDVSLVDDVVQDVFLDCYRQMDSLENSTHARRWLAKITVRKVSKRLKKKKLVHFFHLLDSHPPEPTIPLVTADERAQLGMLYRILERLPVAERMAWSLRYLEGAQLSEVADACGCSLATAKRRIQSAQQAIKGEDHD